MALRQNLSLTYILTPRFTNSMITPSVPKNMLLFQPHGGLFAPAAWSPTHNLSRPPSQTLPLPTAQAMSISAPIHRTPDPHHRALLPHPRFSEHGRAPQGDIADLEPIRFGCPDPRSCRKRRAAASSSGRWLQGRCCMLCLTESRLATVLLH